MSSSRRIVIRVLPRGTATIAPRFPLLKSYSFFMNHPSYCCRSSLVAFRSSHSYSTNGSICTSVHTYTRLSRVSVSRRTGLVQRPAGRVFHPRMTAVIPERDRKVYLRSGDIRHQWATLRRLPVAAPALPESPRRPATSFRASSSRRSEEHTSEL